MAYRHGQGKSANVTTPSIAITLELKSILGLGANFDRANTLGLIFGKSAELREGEG
jgi:hypothetical protein